ncbi:hypothetical protein OIU34_02675 [Pararhizobium sp. BT-229]|uniref:hypothetical protein n=1 Tax=Pararhizobium sp. BT-229 TaxID=2986923 RepID=UPI0021F7EBE0|nr:hypothetical protein [Pararhizobium sp. BT-229]MCV9960793.1 hypothetical protein [Pararhizobium sp. BT-229]
MPDSVIAPASPTDLQAAEPVCSFCDLPPRYCAVLLYNATKTAFICDHCAPSAAAQCRDIAAAKDLP